jgi:hypothetical protein
MIKLTDLILEARNRPKAVIMAGGAGSGKSYLLNQLDLGSLKQFNPDKYVEDKNHPYYNNLGAASVQVEKDVLAAAEDKISLVWDTTASGVKFDENLDKVLKSGYDVYMVMVYTHPMISYISNFSRERNIPAVSVFTTWRNAYKKIEDFNKKLKGNLSIFVNDRGGEFSKEIEAFNLAAKNGPSGIKDYLQKYNEKHDVGKSSFFKPVEMTKEEEDEFYKATQGIDWDKENRSEDKAIKTAFLKSYQKIGTGPGADQLKDTVKKYREKKEKDSKTYEEVLNSIADMVYSPVFQDLLKHSSVSEIDSNVQNFLA